MFGRFTLKRVLGRGGMGIVWLAQDEELQREVAMKFLPEMLTRDEEAINDLKRETRRSLDLTHHHIVRIYDLAQDGQSAAIVMEYVDGDSLSTMKTKQPGGCFGVSEIARWVSHFCQAMEYAHRQARVVHRDLKPANLMINGRGDLKVTDFGISRSLSDSMTRVSQSNSAGTLAYMSPEQALGASPAPADDIYAFGATLYDLLTGRPPFFRGNLQVQLENVMPPPMMQRRAELDHEAEPIPDLWEEVIRTCLAKNPEDRPKSLMEVGNSLGLLTHTTAPSRPTTKAPEVKTAPVSPAPPSTNITPAPASRPATTPKSNVTITSLEDVLTAPYVAKPNPALVAAPSPAAEPKPAPALRSEASVPQKPAKRGNPLLLPAIAAAVVALIGMIVFLSGRKPATTASTTTAPTPAPEAPAAISAPTPAPATPDPQRAAADKLIAACEQAIASSDFAAARRDLAALDTLPTPDGRTAGLRERLQGAEMRKQESDFVEHVAAAKQAIETRNLTAARVAIGKAADIQEDARLEPLRKAVAQLEAPPPTTPAPAAVAAPPSATPKRSTPRIAETTRTPEVIKKPPAPQPATTPRERPPVARATAAPAQTAPATPRRVSSGVPGN